MDSTTFVRRMIASRQPMQSSGYSGPAIVTTSSSFFSVPIVLAPINEGGDADPCEYKQNPHTSADLSSNFIRGDLIYSYEGGKG